MQEGMPIDGAASNSVKKRGPKPGFKRAATVRPSLHDEPAVVAATRPSLRRDSVREAEEYADKIINGLGGSLDVTDEFYIDPDTIPEGWDYNWKAIEIAGKPNQYHMVSQKRNGWRPVDASRHPEIMPDGSEGPIIKKGLMLMEMPKSLVDRYKKMQLKESRDQLSNADRQLHESPAHTAPRDEFPERLRVAKKEVMRPVQQED
jgi:hypothetical protein